VILVTGSSGLVGSHLLYDLIQRKEPVLAMYRSEKRKARVEQLFNHYNQTLNQKVDYSSIQWVQSDILDIDSFEEAIKGVDQVIHCAALVSFHRMDFSRCISINRTGTANVVNLCLKHGIKKLCYISSTAALGTKGLPVKESTSWTPGKEVSGYSISKHSAEKEVFRGIAEGLNASIVNPCVILGPGHWYRSSLTIMHAASRGMRFYPSGANAIVDARDVSQIVLRLLASEESGEKYLLIGKNIPFEKLFGKIGQAFNKSKPSIPINKQLALFVAFTMESLYRLFGKRSPVSVESIQASFKSLEYSNAKVVKRFNYQFHSIEDTIENTIKGRFHD
jgi:nucleoside-diphosphate-sugar epimerase